MAGGKGKVFQEGKYTGMKTRTKEKRNIKIRFYLTIYNTALIMFLSKKVTLVRRE